ncbi:FYVE zinc finger [Venustampulla echinocandica]|uniref:FYVE zinc finger n=1 Tax=Venustampulla echinocandica TaxID=2656787 RepID=A0A370TYT1_9HELO|nr:FYVE zinc finger [Venustampulla echinocandica]RDL40687.1 FYVE zinc finger [Venustampulla echinocandica]
MSWDQPTYSFGNPNAQPPTPTKTPISPHFPSPTFQTPRNNNTSFEDRSGWTPQFAEEYSVFNSTPGRLTSAQHHSFVDVSTPRPLIVNGQKLPLSNPADLSAEFGTDAHQLSPHPNVQGASPSNELPPSPRPYSANYNRFDDSSRKKVTPRKPKKRLDEAFSGQTATPPPTASKGSRKLAPKIQTNTMQNESQDGHYGSSQTPTQASMMAFASSSTEMFNYPMSAPATAAAFGGTKPFWDTDTSMNGMDIDFAADDAMFNTGGHRISNSLDWGRSNQIFQDSVNMSSNHPKQVSSKRQRPLAPKISMPGGDIPISMAPFDFHNTSAADDPFSAGPLDGAVDPGLLYSRSNSISMPSAFEDATLPPPRPATSHALEPYQHQLREASRDQEELRRSRSYRDGGKSRLYDRGTVSSPVKGSARPGLYRSVSEVRGKRIQDRPRSRTGRISPVKQQRPPSLSSIPELPPPRARTEVRFTIDSKGRARTETVIIQDKPPRSRGGRSTSNENWESTSTESSSDDEPIIVPSRNTSFTLPPQGKGPKLATFETSFRGADVRRRSTSGYSQSESSSQQSLQFESVESEAETVVDEDDGSGDATLELKRLMESRKQRQMMKSRTPRHHRYSSGGVRGNSRHINYSSSTNISPTTITDPDGATPSSSRSGTTRCVCNNPDNDGFMIQCESCDNWLHAECVGIDRRGLPPVYICAFCANTPNMRGGRLRETAKANPTTHMGSSPLAHKSFKSFR